MYSTIGSAVNLTCNINVERTYLTWLGPPNLTAYAIGNETKDIQDSIKIIGNEQRTLHILQIVKMQDKYEGLYKCVAVKGEECFRLIIPSMYSFNACIHVAIFMSKSVSLGFNFVFDLTVNMFDTSVNWESDIDETRIWRTHFLF